MSAKLLKGAEVAKEIRAELKAEVQTAAGKTWGRAGTGHHPRRREPRIAELCQSEAEYRSRTRVLFHSG